MNAVASDQRKTSTYATPREPGQPRTYGEFTEGPTVDADPRTGRLAILLKTPSPLLAACKFFATGEQGLVAS